MTERVNVVITSPRYWDPDLSVEREILKRFPELDVQLSSILVKSSDDILHGSQDAHAVLTSSGDQISRAVIEGLLPNLRVIGRYAVGVDTIDLDAATDHGVLVTHFPQYCTNEVADHALSLILGLNRRIVELDRNLRLGAWNTHRWETTAILGTPVPPLRELTLGVIGFGRIGRAVVQRANGFGLSIIIHDPYAPEAAIQEAGATSVSLDDVLTESDIVTIHCPLTNETRGMIGAEQFGKMKPSALLVNTARGPIIDLETLATALQTGKLAGAALDVVDPEPLPQESPLYTIPNVILTPHSAYYSERSVQVIRSETFVEALTALSMRRPRVVANPAVLDKLDLAAD